MDKQFRKYVIFWLSQALSQLGSAMTSFALVLWTYTQTGSAMSVSLMTFFNYAPYIVASLFAGSYVDGHNKKRIMLVSDSVCALCSVFILLAFLGDGLRIVHIYLVNGVISIMNAFQGPASSVAIGKLVPKERLAQVSGMNSFSGNLVTVLSPMLAAALFSLGGLGLILAVDLGTFAFAFFVLLLLTIPESRQLGQKRQPILAGCTEGFRYIRRNQGIFVLILTMALLNFFSRLTYENILSPMILARSGNDSVALGVVNAVIGIGGILGGLIVSAGKIKGSCAKLIYFSAGLSFLLGDILMGLGRNAVIWAVAGLAASFPIAFINAGQSVILYRTVPEEIQGRIFAARNALQFCTIPLGILLGGFLADYVMEPFMASDSLPARLLQYLVGSGAGSGMAVMFLCTGVMGALASLLCYRNRALQALDMQL